MTEHTALTGDPNASTSDSSNILWSSARDYARNGIHVFPVYVSRKPNGKKDVRPAGLWRNISSASLADIGAWEQDHPNAGLGIDCGKSGIVVVDCDGSEGIANWLALDPPQPMMLVKTAGGGEHWYYREHPDHVIGNDQSGKVAPKVDIRGMGGFVIAPPTTDGQGGWVRDGYVQDFETGCYVPQVVIDRMKAVKSVPVPSAAPAASVGDPLFDEPERFFTEEQAKDFIRREREKLAKTTSGFNGAINAFAMACAHFPWLVSREACGKHVIKALGPTTGWTAPDADDMRTIESAYSATEGGKSWVAVKREVATPYDVLPPPGQPLKVARELVALLPTTDETPHLAWWREDFYRWTGAHWDAQDMPEIERWLYQQTGDACYLVPAKKEGEEPTRTPWAPTKQKIGNLAHALGVGELQRIGDEDRVLAAANGVIADRELIPHSPKRFNLFSLPFDYDPAAGAPAWQAFLDQVLPSDRQSQEFLAEWFGYVLSGRTDQQKMAALVGQKRSGKGTIARVLTALLGKENVSGLNLGLLSGTFGLEPLVGSALAVASDVRWHSRNIGDAVQALLEVSGEDQVTVHRKNKSAWKGRLGVRFMLMSNDIPTFSDRSGALVDRMIYVSFGQSFFGKEDTSLTEKLMGELPGILNWALDGLDRLNGRGRFTQPESGQETADTTRRLADPIGTFLEDWCEIREGVEITLDHLFLKYRTWCESEGRTKDTTTKEILSRELRSRLSGLLDTKRVKVQGKFTTLLKGITSEAI